MSRSDFPTARPFLPDDRDLEALAEACQDCQGCPLYGDATQAVFGIGRADADIMLVGEQPGVREDRIGEPFVGPAGKVLDQALEEAGIRRDEIYITNAVKHFKSRTTEDRQTGVKPNVAEITACRPWLESEIERVNPEIIVALGAVAARSLTEELIPVGEALDQWMQTAEGRDLLVTYHPSATLRAVAEADQGRMFDAITRTLTRARDAVSPMRPGPRPQA